MTLSQRERILNHLVEYGPLTPLEALDRFGTMRLSERIRELKKQGHEIETTMVTTLTGKRVAQYRLVKHANQIAMDLAYEMAKR